MKTIGNEKYLAPLKMALILPLSNQHGLQFFGDDIETKIMNALDELRKADEKREEEVKKYGDATVETKAAMDKINDTITTMQKQMEEIAAKAARTLENPLDNEHKKGGVDIERKEAFLQWVRGGKASLTSEQKAALANVPAEYKALVEDTTGEIIVPEDLDKTIYTALQKEVVLRSLAQVRQTSSNRVRRIGMGGVTSGWGKLETAASKTLADYESTLVPTEDYIYVQNLYGLTKIGEDELMDSALNLVQYLADAFRQEFAVRESEGFLRGTGAANNQPEGILTNAAIKRKTTEAANAISTDDFLKLMYEVPAQYRRTGSFLTSSAVELALRTLKSNDGIYLWQPSLQAGKPNLFMGKEVHVEDHFDSIATGNEVAVFGDFSKMYQIVDRTGLTITRLNEKYAEEDLVGFKVKKRVGGGVIRPEAAAILKVQ